jgi:hypothetical protein
MRIITSLISSLISLIVALIPYAITGHFARSIGVAVISAFIVAYSTYTYHVDPINTAPIDRGAIISGIVVGSFFGAVFSANSLWMAFWLTGTTVTASFLIGGGIIFAWLCWITGSAKAALQLMKPTDHRGQDE